jgi:phosphoribosylformylglycinamidine cyclo-ligase
VQPLLERRLVKGMAHITGGGIPGNLSRILPAGAAACVSRSAWTPPSIFSFLQAAGDVPADEMFRAFNMGIGLIIVCAANDLDRAIQILRDAGEAPYVIGDIISGTNTVTIE